MVKKPLLFIFCLILMQNFSYAAAVPPKPKTSELAPAPDFMLLDLEGKEISLAALKGKPIILFFWTTWCPYCRGELKELNDKQAEISRNDTQVLAINIEEPAEKVGRFMNNRLVFYKVLLDKEASVANSYSVIGVPTYVYINKAGYIASSSNYFSHSKYEDIALK
ncbi:MAG: TlpA disulfide reductase family protein [Candidatus Omnitrophica bacterium]|nr:TlpA disulfide reductase family protein [Candidatus Omnitrophota bacterium]MDD5592915.1 TlpA disulfide reductase family protein [Candidatus Omnitrophota bacterium]